MQGQGGSGRVIRYELGQEHDERAERHAEHGEGDDARLGARPVAKVADERRGEYVRDVVEVEEERRLERRHVVGALDRGQYGVVGAADQHVLHKRTRAHHGQCHVRVADCEH